MFKPKSNSYKILVGVCSVAATVFAVYLFVFAGTIDSPAVPSDESGRMYTLDQIYHKINSGTVTAKQSVFTEPGSAPASTMHTLDNIYGDFTTDATACAGTTAADVLSGKTFFATSGTTRGADWGPVAGTYVPPKSLVDTGQTTCYDAAGAVITPCGSSLPGQDPEYTSSNSAHTCAMSYTDNLDGTITDNCTGLMWKKCSEGRTYNAGTGACDGSNSTYTWTLALSQCEGLITPVSNDWRLPNSKELYSLVLMEHDAIAGVKAVHGPYINQIAFPSTQSDYYWSSTTYAYYAGYAWFVYFDYGSVDGNDKTDSYYVRCVRQ